MEREAKYAAVATFALLTVAASFLFVLWYSGKSDRRVYERFEIYFNGSVSGLAQGSPVRYLGVDVGRVEKLSVDLDNPGRVKVVAEIDTTAPISGATRARLGLLGLTGLLYIDLQQDPAGNAAQPLERGHRYPVIMSRKGDIEVFVEKLPDLVSHAGAVMVRIERLFNEGNLESVSTSIENIRQASEGLPAIAQDVSSLAADLRASAAELRRLSQRADAFFEGAQPDLRASLASLRVAADGLARTAGSVERILVKSEGPLSQLTGPGVIELQQLVIDLRDASGEVRDLARELRAQPSSLLREPKESGVEIEP